MLSAVQNSLLSLIYPQECSVCSNSVDEHHYGNACRECWANTRIFTHREMLCKKCGALLGEHAAVVPVSCLKCDEYKFETAIAVGVYEKALAATVIRLKTSPYVNRNVWSLIKNFFGDAKLLPGTDLIIPVPLAKARRIERGFNQAEILSREIGRIMRIPVDSASLTRKLHTPMHRAGMDQKARELTVTKAFEVARPNLIRGKNILLVDDVLTSGATASACAAALKKNGSGNVNVFTLARAVMD